MHITLIHPPDLEVRIIIGNEVEGIASKPYDSHLLPLGNAGHFSGLMVDNCSVSTYFCDIEHV